MNKLILYVNPMCFIGNQPAGHHPHCRLAGEKRVQTGPVACGKPQKSHVVLLDFIFLFLTVASSRGDTPIKKKDAFFSVTRHVNLKN
jgi:hypothetical protein